MREINFTGKMSVSDIAKSLQYRYWYDLARHGKTIEPDKDKTPDGYEWKGIE